MCDPKLSVFFFMRTFFSFIDISPNILYQSCGLNIIRLYVWALSCQRYGGFSLVVQRVDLLCFCDKFSLMTGADYLDAYFGRLLTLAQAHFAVSIGVQLNFSVKCL